MVDKQNKKGYLQLGLHGNDGIAQTLLIAILRNDPVAIHFNVEDNLDVAGAQRDPILLRRGFFQ